MNPGDIMNKEIIVLNIIERIESQLVKKKNISVDEVARISGFTKRYTQKIFKEQTNMNISSYIRRRRLTQAAILIKLTRKSFFHIAIDLHFSTQQSFTRAFTREFNITPFQFRHEERFDYSKLLPNLAMKLSEYKIKQREITTLKLNLESFHLQESLLNDNSSRANKFRIAEINNVITNKREAVVVTTLDPRSKSEDIVQLHTRIGFKDNNNFNYEINNTSCWEITYSGTWDDYIKFGRFFILELDFNSFLYFIEVIKIRKESIYDVRLYLPTA